MKYAMTHSVAMAGEELLVWALHIGKESTVLSRAVESSRTRVIS